MAIFLHEFQHAEYDQFIEHDFSHLQKTVKSGGTITEFLKIAGYSPKKIERIQSLIGKGFESNAVNETFLSSYRQLLQDKNGDVYAQKANGQWDVYKNQK